MAIHYRRATRNSGFNEISGVFQKGCGGINTTSFPKAVILGDGSTPVPHYRMEEVFFHAAFFAKHPRQGAVSYIGAGGAYREYPMWDLPAPDTYLWEEFFSEHVRSIENGRISQDLAPVASFASQIAKQRRARLARDASSYGVNIPSSFQVRVLEADQDVPFANLVSLAAAPGMVGQFVCPDCSYQRGEVVWHAVRRTLKLMGSSWEVTKNVNSPAAAKCKGAIAFKEKALGYSLHSLAKATGFRLSGRVTYGLLASTGLGLFVRDYSNARGTMKFIHDLWGCNMWISTGFTLRSTPSSQDVWEFPLLSDGRQVEIS